MRSSPVRRRAARESCLAALIALLCAEPRARAALATTPGPTGPLVQSIEATGSAEHVDLTVQFACSMRYLSHASTQYGESTTIRLMLGPDCGAPTQAIPPELPLVGGGAGIVRGARVESWMPGEITLRFDFVRPESVVVMPLTSGFGLRLRLLHTATHRGSVRLAAPRPPSGYSVNLESARTPFAAATVQAAARSLGIQAYVSRTAVDGVAWYRLRIGPFDTRAAADAALRRAIASYPHAWVTEEAAPAVVAGTPPTPVAPIAATLPTDPPLPDAERSRMLREARVALAAHHYPRALDLLTRLVRQPEYPGRAQAQELLGLTRERAGQLAEAQAEYREYLRRYPNGPAAATVRMRLQLLATATLPSRGLGRYRTAAGRRYTANGGASLSYVYNRDQTRLAGAAPTTTSTAAALVYGDLLLRDHGSRYDVSAHADGGYSRSITAPVVGSAGQDQVSAAYGEVTDRRLGWTARLGRQTVATAGTAGLFDGLYLGYRPNGSWAVSGAVGLPAYTGYSSPIAHDRFGSVSAEYHTPGDAWTFDTYALDETNPIATERRSVGLQTRYTSLARTAVLLVDYDLVFKQLNAATLIGNTKIGSSWIVGFDLDHRRSPLLGLSNALIGQTTLDLRTLATLYTPSQLRQMAIDRTATSNAAVISANRSFGAHWQFIADLSALELSGTPASFGVAATRSTGLDKNLSIQLAGTSLLQAGDLQLVGLRYDDSPIIRSETLSWNARFVVHGGFHIGPQLSVERLNDTAIGGTQMLYLPQLQADWIGRRSMIEFTAGYQIVNQAQSSQILPVTGAPVTGAFQERSLYATAAYRLRF